MAIKKRRSRKKRNRKLICYCMGWWFPHRMGSKASYWTRKKIGAEGCFQVPDVYTEDGSCPF